VSGSRGAGGSPTSASGSRVSGLYFVTADVESLGRTHETLTVEAIAGGARVVQFRHKRRDARRAAAARAVRAVCSAGDVLFIVNDDAELAADVGADGLHVGQSDLAGIAVWREMRPDGLLGVSVASVAEAHEAIALGADHLGVGPIFATPSKDDATEPIGLAGLAAIREAVDVPLAAIGGITAENAADVFAAGADAICVISAISHAEDPRVAATELAQIAAGTADTGAKRSLDSGGTS
jgi:thiamine-phosphate pyrophosphorylase